MNIITTNSLPSTFSIQANESGFIGSCIYLFQNVQAVLCFKILQLVETYLCICYSRRLRFAMALASSLPRLRSPCSTAYIAAETQQREYKSPLGKQRPRSQPEEVASEFRAALIYLTTHRSDRRKRAQITQGNSLFIVLLSLDTRGAGRKLFFFLLDERLPEAVAPFWNEKLIAEPSS